MGWSRLCGSAVPEADNKCIYSFKLLTMLKIRNMSVRLHQIPITLLKKGAFFIALHDLSGTRNNPPTKSAGHLMQTHWSLFCKWNSSCKEDNSRHCEFRDQLKMKAFCHSRHIYFPVILILVVTGLSEPSFCFGKMGEACQHGHLV